MSFVLDLDEQNIRLCIYAAYSAAFKAKIKLVKQFPDAYDSGNEKWITG